MRVSGYIRRQRGRVALPFRCLALVALAAATIDVEPAPRAPMASARAESAPSDDGAEMSSPWELVAAERDGQHFIVHAAYAACLPFVRAEVQESETQILVTSVVREDREGNSPVVGRLAGRGRACHRALRMEAITLHLRAPVADREFVHAPVTWPGPKSLDPPSHSRSEDVASNST